MIKFMMLIRIISFLSLTAAASAIWPEPRHYIHGEDVLWIHRDVEITYNICHHDYTEPSLNQVVASDKWFHSSCSALDDAIARTLTTLFEHNIVPWKFHPRGVEFEPSLSEQSNRVKQIKLNIVGDEALRAILSFSTAHLDEAYTLNITASGAITVTAASMTGLIYGLCTFTQLFYQHSSEGVYTKLAPLYIADAPKFGHRGLNLDVSRSYYQVEDLLRTVDALAFVKMNRLHLHITDSQAWPLIIPSMPELARKGAYQPHMTYTPEDINRIQQYAANIGVQVYLEIDMPGHTSSIYHAYPELIAAYNIQPNWIDVAAEPPSGTLKLNSSAVDAFLRQLLDDVLPRLSPYSTLFHTGGDEIKLEAYLYDDTVQSSDPLVIRPLLQAFLEKAHARIRAYGLTPVVWEETLLHYNLTLGKDVVVQSWLDERSVVKIVEAGHKVLVGSHNLWYLDCGHGSWLDEDSSEHTTYPDWCSPRKNWRLMYDLDPLLGIPHHLQHLVLGGEVSLWSEQTDPSNLDTMLWPRTCAAAEVLWSGAHDRNGTKRAQATARLAMVRERLVARGVRAEPVRMAWCEMQGGCNVP